MRDEEGSGVATEDKTHSVRTILGSKQVGELLQIGNSGDQPLLRQDREILVDAFGRILQARANFPQRGTGQTGRERQLVAEEVVRVLGLDAEGRKCLWWEVLQVLSDDGITAPSDCGRQNMSIVGVRQ